MKFPVNVEVIFDGDEPRHPVLLSEPQSIGFRRSILAASVGCAMYDNEEEGRREFWRHGTVAFILSKDAVQDEQDWIASKIESGKIPSAASMDWVSNRVLGNDAHIRAGYRPDEHAETEQSPSQTRTAPEESLPNDSDR